jgi:hypothetical protein
VAKGLDARERDARIALASTMTWDANLRKVLERVELRLARGRGQALPPRPEPRLEEG